MKQEDSHEDDEWHKAMTKLFPFLGSGKRRENEYSSAVPPNVLMEVVSARGLNSIKGVDPYCLIRVGGDEVHRTKIIWNDPDPIWTILTGSLCLLHIPQELDEDDDSKCDEESHSVVVEVNHANQCIGIVSIPFREILSKIGDREEFPIRLKANSKQMEDTHDQVGTLALRFRKATMEDLNFFMSKTREKIVPEGASKPHGHGPRVSISSSRKGPDGKILFKTQPNADPDRLEETAWLTHDELQNEALGPSTTWIEAGYGSLGKVFVELICCENLINLDLGLNDSTDSFAAIVFEDSMVTTDIIYDCLNPRWMPWSRRAFAFNIYHPSSMLFLGVFDHDEMGNHDPIGRLVINTSKFHSNTTYLLHYHLRHHENVDEERGVISVRLRVEWNSEREAVNRMFTLPPRFIINVQSEKSLELIRYICRGPINVAVASVESVKILAKELIGYGSVICYILDVVIGIWLWRGQIKMSIIGRKVTVWFPVHSVVVFAGAIMAIEYPLKVPAILIFCIAWALLTLGYHHSTHPDPWQRCKSIGEMIMVSALGRHIRRSIHIEPNVDSSEADRLAKLDKVKADRVAGFLYDFMMIALKIRRIYKKTDVNNIVISMEDSASWSFLGNNLYYVHLALYYMVTYLNMFRNYVNWQSYGAFFTSMKLLALGTAFLIFPIHVAILWLSRLYVWIILGPLMKVVDILFIHTHYRTREELERDPKFYGTNLESVLTTSSLESMIDAGRRASEEAMKLKAMREYKFGKLSLQVPAFDTQRQPSVPLPQSKAEPYLGSDGDPAEGFVDADASKIKWSYVAGQHLTGTMVHNHAVVSSGNVNVPKEDIIVEMPVSSIKRKFE